jgi:hypothetical protein
LATTQIERKKKKDIDFKIQFGNPVFGNGCCVPGTSYTGIPSWNQKFSLLFL